MEVTTRPIEHPNAGGGRPPGSRGEEGGEGAAGTVTAAPVRFWPLLFSAPLLRAMCPRAPSLVLLPLSNLGNMRSRHRAKVAGSSHAGLLCCPSSRSQSSFFVRRSDQCCRIAFVAVSRRDAVEPSFFCCPTSRVGVCVSLPSSSSSFRRLQLRPPSSLHPFPSPPCVHVLILHYAAWPRISNVLFSSLPGCTSGHDC